MTHTRFFKFILYRLELNHLELQLQPMVASSTWSWVQVQQRLSSVRTPFQVTFSGVKAKIFVPPEAQPLFFKLRPLPYTLKNWVEAELEQLLQAEVIMLTQFSDRSAPIVPVIKADGNIHICGDYKVIVNAVAKPEVYSPPRVDDCFTALLGGILFSKLDLSYAYQQLK